MMKFYAIIYEELNKVIGLVSSKEKVDLVLDRYPMLCCNYIPIYVDNFDCLDEKDKKQI